MRFFRNSLFFLAGSMSGALFFALMGNKLFQRHAETQQAPMARWRWTLNNGDHKVPLMLDWMSLRAGEQVLELGAGTGSFTILAARRIGNKGRLYAIDSQPEMIAEVQAKVKAARLTNVQSQVASAYELPLEDQSIDKAILVDVLPEILDYRRALLEIARVLKTSGTLYIGGEFSERDYWFIGETIRHVEGSKRFVLSTQRGNWWRYILGFRRCDIFP